MDANRRHGSGPLGQGRRQDVDSVRGDEFGETSWVGRDGIGQSDLTYLAFGNYFPNLQFLLVVFAIVLPVLLPATWLLLRARKRQARARIP